MRSKRHVFICILLLTFVLFGCVKKESTTKNDNVVEITNTNPADNSASRLHGGIHLVAEKNLEESKNTTERISSNEISMSASDQTNLERILDDLAAATR